MGVTFLLDTHVLLWLISDPSRVPAPVREQLGSRSNQLLASAASALEISIKIRIGKLDAPDLPSSLSSRLSRIGAGEMAITVEHAVLADSLSWDHRDPFDRLLVAQALTENATLVTVDCALTGLPAPRILTW